MRFPMGAVSRTCLANPLVYSGRLNHRIAEIIVKVDAPAISRLLFSKQDETERDAASKIREIMLDSRYTGGRLRFIKIPGLAKPVSCRKRKITNHSAYSTARR